MNEHNIIHLIKVTMSLIKLSNDTIEANKYTPKISTFTFKFKSDIRPCIVNIYRRVIELYLPTYAFMREDITFDHNKDRKKTPVYNNSMITQMHSFIPIPPLDDNDHDINITINAENTSKRTIRVFTKSDDFTKFKYTVDDKVVDYNDKREPFYLLSLNPGQILNETLVATRNSGHVNNNFSPVFMCKLTYDDLSTFKLRLPSRGQIDPDEMIRWSAKYIIENLKEIKQSLHDGDSSEIKHMDDGEDFKLELHNKYFIYGYDIAYACELNKDFAFVGMFRPHYFDRISIIRFHDPEKKYIEYIDKGIDLLLKYHTKVLELITN